MKYRIETTASEYAIAEIVGERDGMIALEYAGVREKRAAREGLEPYSGGTQVFKTDWVARADIVRMVPLD